MKLTPSEKLAKLEAKQAAEREKIIEAAFKRLMDVWDLTPPEAQQRFLAKHSSPSPQ